MRIAFRRIVILIAAASATACSASNGEEPIDRQSSELRRCSACEPPPPIEEPPSSAPPPLVVTTTPAPWDSLASYPGGVDVTWNAPADSTVGIRRRLAVSWTCPQLVDPSADAYFYPLAATGTLRDRRPPYATYCYDVTATAIDGSQQRVSSCSKTADHEPFFVPITPTVLGARSVRLNWVDHYIGEQSFVVERREVGEEAWQEVTTKPGTGNISCTAYEHVDTRVEPGSWYVYRLKRTYIPGEEVSVSSGPVKTPDAWPPAAPTNFLVTTLDDRTYRLTWTDNSDNEDGFEITAEALSFLGSPSIWKVGKNVTTWTSGTYAAGAQQCFNVRSYNFEGKSAKTTTICAKTMATPPMTAPLCPNNPGGAPIIVGPYCITCGDHKSGWDPFYACSKADGLARVQMNYANCTVVEGTCNFP